MAGALSLIAAPAALAVVAAAPDLGPGATNRGAVHFFADGRTGIDRLTIACDDVDPGPDASQPCDVGAGSYTLEVWVNGTLEDNPTSNGGGDVQVTGFNWISGNIIIDRDIWWGAASCRRDWGVSVAGGFVRFGVGAAGGVDPETTIEGSVNVLDATWHHVTLVRDVSDGRIHIYVDGSLDFSSSLGRSTGDLSHPDDGCSLAAGTTANDLGPEIHLGAEKHGSDLVPNSSSISFRGMLDEFRIWNVARSPEQIAVSWNRVVDSDTAGLVGYWRFEEGMGTVAADSSAAGSPDGHLDNGTPGRGEWVFIPLVPGLGPRGGALLGGSLLAASLLALRRRRLSSTPGSS